MSFDKIDIRETLPEKVFKAIKESILNNELKGGDPLPTEPELEKQFGVSRAVIRDAVRLLKGQGLILIKHGKGMFVSMSQTEAFTDSLLTSLRRDNATAWDVEQFEFILLPQIISIASKEATEDDILNIKILAQNYLEIFRENIDIVSDNTIKAFSLFMNSIFVSTHNKLIILLGDVLVSLRKFRNITSDSNDIENDNQKIIDNETVIINKYIQAIESRDPLIAADLISQAINHDDKIISILKSTPVGSSPNIPNELFFNKT